VGDNEGKQMMTNREKSILYYGKTEPLPAAIPLRAGPLTMIYENGDLRYIKLGDHEIVRRLYVAIRDRNWNTAANVLSDVQIDAGADHFAITYNCTNQLADIDFRWRGKLVGTADGAITCAMTGEAHSTFQRNRIGFCLLHPAAIAGANARITHVDGAVEEHAFPLYIAPQLIVDGIIKPVHPFDEMAAVAHEVTPGVWAEVTFAGEIFEMEDQRNWTDASFKTYGTPLRLPFPATVAKGTRIEQTVTIQATGHQPATVSRPASTDQAPVRFNMTNGITTLPKIGIGVASHGEPLQPEEIARLRLLQLAHLRVDLTLADAGFNARLQQAADEARAVGVPLEIAVHLSAAAEQELSALVDALAQARPVVARWLIFTKAEKTTGAASVNLARRYLAGYDSSVPIGAGTNVYFTELNSRRPPLDALDVVAYSINPQVHAFDNRSLVETLAAQGATASSARQFCGDRPLAVSPITLQPRFNPNATGPEPEPAPDELPPQVDPRQLSLFGAGWTLGSIKYLAESGVVDSITYYETTGWRGVMAWTDGSPLPDKFPSIAGGVFPLYHVLADVGEFTGGEVWSGISSDPLRVDGLVLKKAGELRVLLVNFTEQPQQVDLTGVLNVNRDATVRRLDETNVLQAMHAPAAYRATGGTLPANTATITLPPFGLVSLDQS
jgi:hypothetical protein